MFAPVGSMAGSRRLGASVYVVEPGRSSTPYHFHRANEELLMVFSGRPTLRTPEGERELDEGAVVSFRPGPVGAHQVINRSSEPSRTPVGEEELAPGDVVAHPVGPDGAHQVTNRSGEAVRFLMLSEMEGPEVVVYPDSDKVGARSDAPGPNKRSELWKAFRAGDEVDYFTDEVPPTF